MGEVAARRCSGRGQHAYSAGLLLLGMALQRRRGFATGREKMCGMGEME